MTARTPPFPWEAVLDRLSALYGRGDWRVPYLRDHAENPFQVLIGTILSQRTRDEATDAASEKLFRRFPDASSLARASVKEIEPLIRGTGFYHVKARKIRESALVVRDRFDGRVPSDLESLLELPGVGRKTANCVLVFGYGLPGVPVDTHVHRISNRLGVVRTRTPEQTETALRELVDPRYWIPLNPLLVQHGQNLCRPRRPLCNLCPILEFCATGVALGDGKNPPRQEDRPVSTRRRRNRGKLRSTLERRGMGQGHANLRLRLASPGSSRRPGRQPIL